MRDERGDQEEKREKGWREREDGSYTLNRLYLGMGKFQWTTTDAK